MALEAEAALRFGSTVVGASALLLYSTPLVVPATSAALLATPGITSVPLNAFAGRLKSLAPTAKHLAFIPDGTGVVRAVCAWKVDGAWRGIARDIDDPDLWFSDPAYGTLLVYSTTPIPV